jgi:hypothetical protein
MLKIRAEQYRELGKMCRERFVDEAVEHLCSRYPGQTAEMEEAGRRQLVETGIEEAKGHGVRKERDILRYLECMVEYGPRFPDDAGCEWAAAILRDPALTGTQKMERIADYATFSLRD